MLARDLGASDAVGQLLGDGALECRLAVGNPESQLLLVLLAARPRVCSRSRREVLVATR